LNHLADVVRNDVYSHQGIGDGVSGGDRPSIARLKEHPAELGALKAMHRVQHIGLPRRDTHPAGECALGQVQPGKRGGLRLGPAERLRHENQQGKENG
jgi:hypothetical protein